MNKILKALALFLLVFSHTTVAQAAYTENWQIDSFHAEIFINENGLVEVTETIIADFTNESHKGMLRSIPYKYVNGRFAKIDYKSAIDENGNPWSTDTYKENGYLNIPMKTEDDSQIYEEATFILKYSARNIFNFFDEHDEFYWNVNGTDWVVAMNKVSATIHLPVEPTNIKCITGKYGYTNSDCEWTTNEKIITFTSKKPLEAYENLTVVIALPPNTVSQTGIWQLLIWALIENKGILLAPLTFIIMYLLWYHKGRDEKTLKTTVMPHYKPPQGLLPSETGTLIDEKIDPRDITATIIDHAIKGHIKITELKKKGLIGKNTDYELELIKQWVFEKEYEDQMLKAIFKHNKVGMSVKISDLQNSFYTHIKPLKKEIFKQLIKDGFFPHNPASIRSFYMTMGGVSLVLTLQLMGLVVTMFSGATGVGLLISEIIIMIFGYHMPRKTKKGTETYYELKGLFEYIKTAEKDRLKFQEDNNILFEKLLPYAISFGLVEKWSEAFAGIIKTAPDWFIGYGNWHNDRFSMAYFGNRLQNFSYKTSTNIVSKPGGKGGGGWSGGSGFSGGFSGGGFGGGGGHGL
ncbi:MAG: DUF2207 domain-containing protein [bacterium]|nr:DUF2207 domain-containing protein [bacterium]